MHININIHFHIFFHIFIYIYITGIIKSKDACVSYYGDSINDIPIFIQVGNPLVCNATNEILKQKAAEMKWTLMNF